MATKTTKPTDDAAKSDTSQASSKADAAPKTIRCTKPLRVPSCPWRHNRSLQVRWRDVFSGERAAWLWEQYGAAHFEAYAPTPRKAKG